MLQTSLEDEYQESMDLLQQYREKFDSASFLQQYHTFPKMGGRIRHQLKFYHEAFKNIPCGVKVLEYGAGPSLSAIISSATKGSEIVLAEYTLENRKALSEWLDNDPNAFDWSPHFDYVVKELEGKGDDEVKERVEHARKIVKAVVPCDSGAKQVV